MQFGNKQVLIVEDQRPFLLVLKGLMQSMGVTDIVTKSSAEQAVVLCKKHKFDIVISDLHLGSHNKNGYELVEELRVSKLISPAAVVILISADSARPVVLGSIDKRPDDFLIKPFSQAQLKTRIVKAWKKRQFFFDIYKHIEQQQIPEAIEQLKDKLNKSSYYKGNCEQLLVELYWQRNTPEAALEVLNEYADNKPVQWAQIALGNTHLKLQHFDSAISAAKRVIKKNRFNADAYDILAHAHLAQHQEQEAIDDIKEAIRLSPFSLQRHIDACNIARETANFDLAAESSQALWNLSKRSVHKDCLYWCGMVRSLLDVAEHSKDKKQKNKFQQEALLTLQRGKFDEHLQRMDKEFDVDIFSEIINARVSAIDGKLIDAKRHLDASQRAIGEKYSELPTAYIPDSLDVMYTLGEFDDALELAKLLKSRGVKLDKNSKSMLEKHEVLTQKNLASYQQFNREGIEHYQNEDYDRARASFALAQGFAPVNTGVALNLLQCLLQLTKKTNHVDTEVTSECKRLFKLIDDMTLKPPYKEKYVSLRDELSSFIGF